MGCSGRVKAADIKPEQKWDFISLNDFHSTSCFEFLAYAYLWVNLLISLAVYGVDTFLAVNLLAFDKWSSSVQPVVEFDVQKWIFAGCIIASWVNLGYEHLRAARVMKRGAVAESFLDSLAVRLQSARMGKGRGWRRFLVFSELTKSQKGAEYVALFTFFGFQSWIRIIVCQGPRQVLNALTLWAVVKSFDSTAENAGSTLLKFFKNVGKLADENHQQTLIYSGMLFTLVVWAFGAMCLLLSALFYILFLWHYIPNTDGGLSAYCERKVNRKLARIVSAKVNKALEEEDRKMRKLDAKAVKNGERPLGRQATLPTLPALSDQKSEDSLPRMPMLYRNDTMTTLPAYTSRPGTPSGQPTLPVLELNQFDQKRPIPSRQATNTSYASSAPLVSNASDMGYSRSGSPAPPLPTSHMAGFPGPPPRSMTANSNHSNWSRGPPGPPGPPRMPSAIADRGYTASPVSYDGPGPGPAHARPLPRAVGELRSQTPLGSGPGMGRRMPSDQASLPHGPQVSPMSGSEHSAPYAPYQAYNPAVRSASAGPGAPSFPNGQQPMHHMMNPGPRPPHMDRFNSPPLTRPNTAPSSQVGGPRGVGGSVGPSNGISRIMSPAPYPQGPNPYGPGGQPYRR